MAANDLMDTLRSGGVLVFDGGYGTLFQRMGLPAGASPDLWNTENPEAVQTIHEAYARAGSQITKTNTFGAARFGDAAAREEIVRAGVALAVQARQAVPETPGFVALDLGPSGLMLAPYGDTEEEEVAALYRSLCSVGLECGADLILIETMMDLGEALAALKGAKEALAESYKTVTKKIPVFVTMTYAEGGRTLFGQTAADCAEALEEADADAIGLNCGAGPELAAQVLPQLRAACSLPLIANPNAGLPVVADGTASYPLQPEDFAAQLLELKALGACVLGGCCGTSPTHIAALVQALRA
ncbi:MAG: homocysteine S-methyltransferase family protein [Oscillospiraceae bacterium]|jgi:5-methyltetrahydrofolate--homocysteine methyltransferase|nr:homocysteine S-methyltransferase family protein [Oscillospiraceae bacterium]